MEQQELEREMLGAILINGTGVSELFPDLFTEPAHKLIIGAMFATMLAGQTVNIQNVADKLQDKNIAEDIYNYLAELTEGVDGDDFDKLHKLLNEAYLAR